MMYDPNKAAIDPSNLPSDYDTLDQAQKEKLGRWIVDEMPLKNIQDRTSYGLKHVFENSPQGFYITNGQFKGAMLAAGYEPDDAAVLNWHFI